MKLEQIVDVPYKGRADSPYFTDNREFIVRKHKKNTCKAQKVLERNKEKYGEVK